MAQTTPHRARNQVEINSKIYFFVLATIKKENELAFLQPKNTPCFYLIPDCSLLIVYSATAGRRETLLQIPPRVTPHYNVAELCTKIALDWSTSSHATPVIKNITTTPTVKRTRSWAPCAHRFFPPLRQLHTH